MKYHLFWCNVIWSAGSDLVTFVEKILQGKLYFLCSECCCQSSFSEQKIVRKSNTFSFLFLLLFQWYISDFHCGKGVNLNWFTTLFKYYRQPKKYLQSDWSRRIQYWPDCIFGPNIALFDKRNKNIRFSLPEKIEIYSLKLNE